MEGVCLVGIEVLKKIFATARDYPSVANLFLVSVCLFVVLYCAGLFHRLPHHCGLAADPVALAVILVVRIWCLYLLAAHVY